MTKREIAAVGCRLLSLAMGGFGCATLARPIGSRLLGQSFASVDNAMPVVTGLVWLIVSVYIWSRADVFAARMLDDDPSPVTSNDLTAEDVLSLGTAVIGIWLAGPAFVEFVNLGFEYWPSESDDEPFEFTRVHVGVFGPSVVQGIVGIWCLLGSRGIAKLVGAARTVGFDRAAPRNDAAENA